MFRFLDTASEIILPTTDNAFLDTLMVIACVFMTVTLLTIVAIAVFEAEWTIASWLISFIFMLMALLGFAIQKTVIANEWYSEVSVLLDYKFDKDNLVETELFDLVADNYVGNVSVPGSDLIISLDGRVASIGSVSESASEMVERE